MKIQKLIRQYGEHGNDYSVLEIGDKVNEIIDLLQEPSSTFIELKKDGKQVVENIEEKSTVGKIVVEGKEYAARSPSTADRVYLIKDGKKHWIKNPETLVKLGFNFQTVKGISNEEMAKFELGEPINLKEPKILEVKEEKESGDKYNL